jgi:hypothetical protein
MSRRKVTLGGLNIHGSGSCAKQAGSGNPESLDPALVSRFVEAMARRGVPELGAKAVLKQIRKTAELSRTGRLTDEQCEARMALVLIKAEDKATELAREQIRLLAEAVSDGRVSLADARSKIRGTA